MTLDTRPGVETSWRDVFWTFRWALLLGLAFWVVVVGLLVSFWLWRR